MFKLLHIVGTRPQIIKSAALSRVIKNKFAGSIQDIKLDTGQHYDDNLQQVFYTELGMDAPMVNLVGSTGNAAAQLGAMVSGIGNTAEKHNVDALLVYGDTNTTLAGAMAAHAMQLPLFHVEAGLRSHNFSMPEEFNRIFTDKASSLLFAPTKKAVQNLVKENYRFPGTQPYNAAQPGVIYTGDVMYDNYLHYHTLAVKPAHVNITPGFILVTIHRNYNADKPGSVSEMLQQIVQCAVQKNAQVLFPVHPRTRKQLEQQYPALWNDIKKNATIILTEPLSYLQMLWALQQCALVMTDSGGLQKEAYFAGKYTVILRSETEWTELVEDEKAQVVGNRNDLMRDAFNFYYGKTFTPGNLYGDANAATQIAQAIIEFSQRT